VEPREAADKIAEVLEEQREELAEERAERRVSEQFRSQAAIVIAILAMLLAISALGGDHAKKEAVNANIQASDAWAFYQAKNIRQTTYALSSDQLEALIASDGPGLADSARQSVQAKIEQYRRTVTRYDDEPDPNAPNDPLKGDGKKQLMARAQHFEHERDHALAQDPNFDYATAIYQIAIVLGSVSIIAASRIILLASVALGVVASLLLVNGHLLFAKLPG